VTRVLSGAVLLALAIGVVWWAQAWVFLLVAEALLLLAFVEYRAIAAATGVAVPRVAGLAAGLTAAAFSGATFGASGSVPLDGILISAFVALCGLAMAEWRGGPGGVVAGAAAIFPAIYLGLPVGAMVAIRETAGREALFLMMLTVFVSDTAQYYSGRAFGRRLLAPAISPKKTIEGALGGFVCGGAFLALAGDWWLPSVPLPLRVALGVTLVALGIVGDLFESMLKRSAGVKDSSTLIPGHGGVLDRIDALLFAAPVYYLVLKYL
jgi:phosphatidate cytidylyltransferase